jgi:hypothetical protein
VGVSAKTLKREKENTSKLRKERAAHQAAKQLGKGVVVWISLKPALKAQHALSQSLMLRSKLKKHKKELSQHKLKHPTLANSNKHQKYNQ